MNITFTSTNICGFLTSRSFKTLSGAKRFALKRLRRYKNDMSQLGLDASAVGVEIWLNGDSRPFYNPDNKPDYIIYEGTK